MRAGLFVEAKLAVIASVGVGIAKVEVGQLADLAVEMRIEIVLF
jgi:hypothetical protein